MSTMTLEPCPFCGMSVEYVTRPVSYGREFWYVYHPEHPRGECILEDQKFSSASGWNCRTNLAQPAEAVDVGSIREVHDALLDHFIAANVDGTPYPHVSAEDLGDWCEVLAHCISTRTRREAIDADAIKKVAEEAAVLATWETVQLSSVQLQAWADKLVRSISGEKAGSVMDGVTATDFAMAMRNCGLSLLTYAAVDREARRLAKERVSLPISPAPHKESQP